MTQNNAHDDNTTNAPGGKPSQAEGERQHNEETRSERQAQAPSGHPSQAEGSREQVEEDLNER